MKVLQLVLERHPFAVGYAGFIDVDDGLGVLLMVSLLDVLFLFQVVDELVPLLVQENRVVGGCAVEAGVGLCAEPH